MRDGAVPEVFLYQTPDDSMVPDLPKGSLLVLTTHGAPARGECALVKDATGRHVLRKLVESRGVLQAQASNRDLTEAPRHLSELVVVARSLGLWDGRPLERFFAANERY